MSTLVRTQPDAVELRSTRTGEGARPTRLVPRWPLLIRAVRINLLTCL